MFSIGPRWRTKEITVTIMFKKYLQVIFRTLFKESLSNKQPTKQTSVKDARFDIRRTKALIKPETLAIIGNNQRPDSQSSSEGLKLRRIFESVLKKFVNPKLDLMATLEQIRAMEANRREELIKSLGGFFKFESRSRLPALPPANTSETSYARTVAEEMSIGWTGQPTAKRIICSVETSTPITKFGRLDESHPAKSKPLAVRTRRASSRSNKRSRRRKRISPATSPIPEFSKVHVDRNKDIVDAGDRVHSANAERSVPDVKDRHAKVYNLGTVASPMKFLGELADVQYRNARKKSHEFCQKLKDGIEGKIRGIVGLKHTNKFYLVADTHRSLVQNCNSGQRRNNPSSIPWNRTKTSGHNEESERAAEGTDREVVAGDRSMRNNKWVYNVKANGIDNGSEWNNAELLVELKETSFGELSNVSTIKTGKCSTSGKVKSREFQIPKKLVKNIAGTDSVKNYGPSKWEQLDMEKFTKNSLPDLVKVSAKSNFANIEANEPISYRSGNKKYKKKPTNNKSRAKSDELKKRNHKIKNEFTENKRAVSYTVKRKTLLDGEKNKSLTSEAMKFINQPKEDLNEEVSDVNKNENAIRETKSEGNARSERKIRTPRRLFPKALLMELNNKKVTAHSNNLKQKVWLKDSYKKTLEKYERNTDNRSNSKVNLPNLMKVQENVKDIIPKCGLFKAGNYMPRSKHFPIEKFPSVERLHLSKRNVSEVSPSKHSLELHDDENFLEPHTNEIGKIKAPSLSKQASNKNMFFASACSQRPRTALAVKGKKRTKMISSSIPSLTVLRQKSDSLKEALKKGLNSSRNTLSVLANLKRSQSTPFKKESIGTSIQYKNSYTKTKNHTHQKNTKQTNSMKTQAYRRFRTKQEKGEKINTSVIESNAGNVKAPSHTLKVSEVHKLYPREPDAKTVLKKNVRSKEVTSITNSAQMKQNSNSVKKIVLKNRLELSNTNRITSNSSAVKKKPLKQANSANVSKKLPVINVLHRSFSTTVNNRSRIVQVKNNRSLTAKTSISTPVINYNGSYIRKNVQNIFKTNLEKGIRFNSKISQVEKEIPIKEVYRKQKDWETIEDRAKKSYKSLHSLAGLAPSEGGEIMGKTTRKRSLQRKMSNILKFKTERQVSSSSKSDNTSTKKELNLEVLYKSSKIKDIGSKMNIHVPKISNKPSMNKKKIKRLLCSSLVGNDNLFPAERNQNADECVNRVNTRSLKFLDSPTAENVEGNQPRKWKSRAQRVKALQINNKPNRSMLNLKHHFAKATDITKHSNESNQHQAHCMPVNTVVKLDTNEKRLISKIDKYKFPRCSQAYNENSCLQTTSSKTPSGNLSGMREKQIILEKIRQRRTNCPIKIKGYNNRINSDWNNAEITKERDNNDKQSNILFRAEGKERLALLQLNELIKSTVSKSHPGKDKQLTPNKVANKTTSTVHHRSAIINTPSKVRNGRSTLINVSESTASRMGKSAHIDMNTILSNLVTEAKKADSLKSTFLLRDRSNDVNNQLVIVTPPVENRKLLNSEMKDYKPDISTKKGAISRLTRSVNSTIVSTDMSSEETPIKINSQIGVEAKHNARMDVIGKSVEIDKKLSRLDKIMTDNQITEELTPIRPSQVPSSQSNKNNTRTPTLQRYGNKTTPPGRNLTHNLKLSKSYDNQNYINNLKAPQKINIIDGNNNLFKIRSDEYLNKNNQSSKSFKALLRLSKDKNKSLLCELIKNCSLRITGTTKNLSTKYDTRLPIEKRILTSLNNKADLNKIRTILKSDPSKHTNKTLRTTHNLTISYPNTFEKPKIEVQRQIVGYKHKSNKNTKEPCTRLEKRKIATCHISKCGEEKSSNNSVPIKLTRILKLDLNEPELLLLNQSSNKYSHKVDLKCIDKPESFLAPNKSKDIVMQSNDISKTLIESIKYKEMCSTDKYKVPAETILTSNQNNYMMANNSKQNEMKPCTNIEKPVKNSKVTEITLLSSSLIGSEKFKSLEQQKEINIQKRHPIAQVNPFYTPAVTVDQIKNQLQKYTVKKQALVSKNKSEDVKNLNKQYEQQNACEHFGCQENKLTRQKTHIIGDKAHKESAKVETQENVTSCDKNSSSVTVWGGNLSIEPGLI